MAMVKKTISFKNISGEDVTEDWYFSLDESDAVDMELVHRPDVEDFLTDIVKNRDSRNLLDVYKQVLFASVGKKVDNLFVKDEQTLREFKFGGAYRQLFSELLEMDDAGAEFFNAFMPEKFMQQAREQAEKVWTEDELLAMTDEEFAAVAGRDEKDWSREHLLIAMKRKVGKAA